MHKVLFKHENEGGTTTVTLELRDDGSLQVFYHDIGRDAQRVFGDSDYEAWLTIPASEVPKLAFALVADRYGIEAGVITAVKDFCNAQGVACDFGNYA